MVATITMFSSLSILASNIALVVYARRAAISARHIEDHDG